MEHREPLRTPPADFRLDATNESPLEAVGIRVRNRDSGAVARSGLSRRLIVLAAAAFLVLLALGYLASIGTVAAVAWLHRQPYYQLPFDKIQLDPAPPRWYRGGKEAFLEAVRKSARQTRPIARLDVAPAEIAAIFRNYHWVEEVQVRYLPGGIAVHLRYRHPVAYVQMSQGEQLIVDEKGTILPPADVDETQFGPGRLARITAQQLGPPADLTPGVSWKSRTDPNDIPHEDKRILAAAKLAGYLRDKERLQSSQDSPALRIGEIIVTDFYSRGLFVLNDEGQTIWWRETPGEEPPDEPKAAQKWEMLRKWGESSKKHALTDRDYWRFSREGVVPVCLHPDHTHQTNLPHNEDGDANSQRKAAGSG